MDVKLPNYDSSYSKLKATDPIKKYQMMFQDEYNNLLEIGFYDEINEAMVKDINDTLSIYKASVTIEDLKEAESHSPFGGGLDIELYEDGDMETGAVIYIRCFVRG